MTKQRSLANRNSESWMPHPRRAFCGLGGKARIHQSPVSCSRCLCPPCASEAQQPTAHDLAERVDHHYNQLHSLKAQFTESYEGLGRSRIESGTLLLLKPGRMRWDYTSPAGKLFLLDGKLPGSTPKATRRSSASTLSNSTIFARPCVSFSATPSLKKRSITLSLTPAANGSFTVAGIPHGQEKRVQRLALTVTADGAITAIEIQETDGADNPFHLHRRTAQRLDPSGNFPLHPPRRSACSGRPRPRLNSKSFHPVPTRITMSIPIGTSSK